MSQYIYILFDMVLLYFLLCMHNIILWYCILPLLFVRCSNYLTMEVLETNKYLYLYCYESKHWQLMVGYKCLLLVMVLCKKNEQLWPICFHTIIWIGFISISKDFLANQVFCLCSLLYSVGEYLQWNRHVYFRCPQTQSPKVLSKVTWQAIQLGLSFQSTIRETGFLKNHVEEQHSALSCWKGSQSTLWYWSFSIICSMKGWFASSSSRHHQLHFQE